MMPGRVPLARRNLFQDRRRALLAVVGVGAALLLVLVLDGVVDGAMRQVTAYLRDSPADVFVSQRDVRTMHMSQSSVPTSTVERVRHVDGVAWAEGLDYAGSVVEAAGGGRRFTYVLGYETATGRGGPRHLSAGRAPGTNETVVDETTADELHIRLGETVTVLGARFRVSGFATNGTSIANTIVFIRARDFVRLRGAAPAYVLVGARPGTSAPELRDRVAAAVPELTVQTRAEFAHQEATLVRDMAADIMQIMSVVGFLIALAVVALTLFTTTLAKTREYGVVKALGASSGRLAGVVAAQALWSVALGLLVAVLMSLAVGAAISAFTPNLTVVLSDGSVLRTGLGALVVGALASLLPLRRVTRVDPATAFRRP